MNPIRNPFSPGAGTPPPELVGRQEILEKAKILFERIKIGKSEQCVLLVGLRGVGKTVLLSEIDRIAQDCGCKSIQIEANEKMTLASLLLSPLRQLLFQFDRMEALNEKVKRGLRVLKSFINGLRIKYQDIEIGLDIDPEQGTADSGNLEADLPFLFEAIGEAALARKSAVAIIIDEIQYLSEEELSALITAIHKMAQKRLPLTLIGAGLPNLIGHTGKSKSYSERLFNFYALGPLEKEDAISAVRNPIVEQHASITNEALDEIFTQTKGYPYFLQEWGYQAWNLAKKLPIDLEDVRLATEKSLRRLDEGFFRVRFDRLTPREKEYLYALTLLGNGPKRSSDVAEKLKTSSQRVAPIRNNLIKKGMIYSPAHGDTDFTVPLFADFMKRAWRKKSSDHNETIR
ncbi:MAG: ATP-binding protein [Verrucomicrobia bacterium]|nr:ATP-binding protein [Verrucomicrobiota bacterium]MBS0637963.1 ATP-binding protein [Verrucomicrobiota bacterium]